MAKTSKTKTTKKVARKTTKKAANKAVETPTTVEEQPQRIDKIPHETKDNITSHDKFNSMIFILGLIAVIVLLIVISPVGNNSGSGAEQQIPDTFEGVSLEMTTSMNALNIGDEFTTVVAGKNFDDLVGFEINVGFDPAVVEYQSTSYGNFLGTGGERLCVPAENKGNLITKIACIKLPTIPGQPEGVDGDGELVTLKFKAVGRGDPSFQITNIKLLNSEKEYLDHQVLMPNPDVK